MSKVAPTATVLANYDPARDEEPGLLVEKGGTGMGETEPSKYQQWVAAPGTVLFDGPVAVVFWAAMKEFSTPKRGIVEAYLMDCDPAGSDCVQIAYGLRDILDWSGGYGSWSRHAIDFGPVNYTVAEGRSLGVRFVVGDDSDDDIMFAYDTAFFQSGITDSAPGDIAIDCDFSDWTNGSGTDFLLEDQGGNDDFRTPAWADLTVFGVSTNVVDAIKILAGFDNTVAFNGTAGTLFDTDMDGNVNMVLLANIDTSGNSIELYECDDTLTDGCGSANLLRTYDDSCYCSTVAAGPWNDDTLTEMAIPFADLKTDGGPMMITALISYTPGSLLISPMDSVLGDDGQDYDARIYFDAMTGNAEIIESAGDSFIVRRASDPSMVREAQAHQTDALAPFDDLPGTLGNGQTYFYIVEREGGIPVALSAHSNAYLGVVRIGFDDNDPLTAPVDAVYSEVSLDTASIPADGTTQATLSVTPRDTDGELVGAGCDIEIDPSSLDPGMLAGPVTDHLNGSYTIPIIATATGNGEIVVTVEGITLTDQPTIEFTSP